jgi:hypothetical protein
LLALLVERDARLLPLCSCLLALLVERDARLLPLCSCLLVERDALPVIYSTLLG